jgi:hypothetical protein
MYTKTETVSQKLRKNSKVSGGCKLDEPVSLTFSDCAMSYIQLAAHHT